MKHVARKERLNGRKNKPSQSTKQYGSKLTGRSKITNGTHLLPRVDGRSIWARRLRDLITLHVNDYGGEGNISEAQRSLIRRAACLTTELELLEVQFATNGGAKTWQLDKYGRAANTLRRLVQSLGLERRAKEVNATYDQFSEDVERLRETGFIDALNDDRDGAAP